MRLSAKKESGFETTRSSKTSTGEFVRFRIHSTRKNGTNGPLDRYEIDKIDKISRKGGSTMLSTILVVILILMLLGSLPTWGHSRNWGYGPSGGLGLVVLILVILLLMGRI
jgi:Protein of unknown function (DUF3309)